MPDRLAAYDTLAHADWPTGHEPARMQSVVDALWNGLHEHGVSWVGFYLERADAPDDARLVLGPCRDSPACSPIGLHGVCGQALTSGRTRIVRDVAALGEDYVACDPRDRSEIVIPLEGDDGAVRSVLDLDSHEIGAFDEQDDDGLRRVLRAAGFTPA
ncbi:MAG: GAF domain-containing protein [Planctomycetota bacterium]|jgi:putative methionine-R-sulfoxide reductase with GAF domain